MHSKQSNFVATPMTMSTSACSAELRQHMFRSFESFPAPPLESPSSISTSPLVRKMVPSEKASVRWGSAYIYRSNTNPDDFPTMWYNSKDLEEFQLEKRKVIKALKHVKGDLKKLKGTRYVTRGFECYQTVDFNRIVRSQRKAVVENVLQVQNEQILKTGCVNDEEIAQAARQGSMWAREYAHHMGLKDEEAVRLGWQEFFVADMLDSDSSSDPEHSPGDMVEQMHLDDVAVVIDNPTTTAEE